MLDLGPDLPEDGRNRALYREINRLRRAIQMLTPVRSLNLLTNVTAIGTSREALPAVESTPGEPGTVKRYEIVLLSDVNGNSYQCREAGTTGASNIEVAKPFKLRQTPFDGRTISYVDERNDTYNVRYEYSN